MTSLGSTLYRLSRRCAVLRGLCWRLVLARCGSRLLVHHGVNLLHPGAMAFGVGVSLHPNAVLNARREDGKLGIALGDGVMIRESAVINAHGGEVVLGHGSFVGPCSVLQGPRLMIGSQVMLGGGVKIYSSNHVYEDVLRPMKEQGETSKGIEIADDVWIGAGAVILDGVRLGRGCIVGGGAVVTRDIPEFAVAVGNPARIIKHRTGMASGQPA